MKCNIKQQETAECEKRGCEGCYYNQEVDDLTTVYMSGFYDGEKKWKDKIKNMINQINIDYDVSVDEEGNHTCYYPDYTITKLEDLLKELEANNGN